MMQAMEIDIPRGVPGLPPQERKPETPEEAARQFEQVLIKQMLHTMTSKIFDQNLTGEDAPQWMNSYNEIQGDILATELAKQLSESGKLGISEMLLKQWQRQDESESNVTIDAEVNPESEDQA